MLLRAALVDANERQSVQWRKLSQVDRKEGPFSQSVGKVVDFKQVILSSEVRRQPLDGWPRCDYVPSRRQKFAEREGRGRCMCLKNQDEETSC